VARRRNPARLVVALSVAAALAIFLVYSALAGGTKQLTPSELGATSETVVLGGLVVGQPSGNARGDGLRFTLADPEGDGGQARVPVVYHGSVPDLFKPGRHISVTGKLESGVFVAEPDSLVTKCPSKYAPDSDSQS
jgi:cytochrome c-type biogenesis protein CcmE